MEKSTSRSTETATNLQKQIDLLHNPTLYGEFSSRILFEWFCSDFCLLLASGSSPESPSAKDTQPNKTRVVKDEPSSPRSVQMISSTDAAFVCRAEDDPNPFLQEDLLLKYVQQTHFSQTLQDESSANGSSSEDESADFTDVFENELPVW